MAQPEVQTFENHARRLPTYYTVAYGLITINLLWAFYRVVTDFSVDRLMALIVALALPAALLYARSFALRVQDRVIRLEMRLRLAQVLPADLRPRINDLSVNQLCALRFAGDAELTELTRRVLADNL